MIKQGILKGIPIEYTPNEILKDIISPIPIKEITRCTRYEKIIKLKLKLNEKINEKHNPN